MKGFTILNAHTEIVIILNFKMEKAILISRIEDLHYATEEFSRLYFGIEFCERLLHTGKEIDKALSFASERDMAFTYVTPYVTNYGLKVVEKNISKISEEIAEPEIVINDWGVLRIAKKYSITPVLGRLLSKQKRGPEILNLMGNLPPAAIAHFRKSCFEVPVYQNYLKQLGVWRVELDNAFQGIDMDFSSSGIRASLYYPYIYVATTRRCLINSCDVISKRDIIGIYPCHKECREYTVELKHESMPKPILLKGNTQFLYNPELPSDLESKGINRIVFQPTLPM